MNNHLQETINKIIKSYDSIVQKSLKILASRLSKLELQKFKNYKKVDLPKIQQL